MTNDIVAQLRSSDFCSCEIIYRAADRIEQLTNERDKAARLGKSGGYKATPEHSWAEWCDELYRDLNKANDRIEQLEAALQRYVCRCKDVTATGAQVCTHGIPVTSLCGWEARAALEGKDD